MNNFTENSKTMKQFYSCKSLIFTFFILLAGLTGFAQNAIVGSGFSSGWGGSCPSNANFTYFSAGAGTSYTSGTLTPTNTGNQFWRLGIDWSGTIKQVNNGSSTDAAVVPGTKYTINQNCTTTGALFRNVSAATNRYVFKTRTAGTAPQGDWVFFEMSAAPITVSSVSQSPVAASVIAGENAIVTAVASGALPTGQGIYIRYTKDNYTNSTIVAMTNTTGNNYTATIPGSFNTSAAGVSYYIFTSGSGLTITGADADLYTINLNNNSTNNYTYTVSSPGVVYQHAFEAAPSGQSYTGTPTTLNSNFTSQQWSTPGTNNFAAFGGATGNALGVASASGAQSYNLALNVASGFKFSLTNFSFWRQTSSSVTWTMTVNGTTVGAGTSPTSGTTTGILNVTNTAQNLTGTLNVVLTFAGSGSFRLDDFILRGTFTSVPAAPTLTTPTATAITSTSATLGANITSNGGSSISARGTSYKTSSPVLATDNQSAEGGTTTGVYTHSRTGLSPQTPYFYVGYATNTTGTAISAEGSFRTLSSPPTAAVSSFTATASASGTITLNWNAATFPGTGATQAGYAIVYATGTPTMTAANGAAPTAGVGTLVNVTTAISLSPATTTVISGLTNGTTYNFILVPYTYDGTNATTYSYLTGGPTTSGAPLVAPTITTTAAANTITDTTASSGGQTITGSGITAKGVVWDTATTPTVALSTKTNDGSGATNFTSSLTSLAAQTPYFVRAYVTNATGTGYGNQVTFRTLSTPVTTQASNFTATAASSSAINLAWTAATFPGSGATASGYLVYRATGLNTPTFASANGAAPAAGANTTLITTLANNAVSFGDSGLTSSTAYTYLVVPFTWDGTNNTTYNYLNTLAVQSATTQSGPPSISTTTSASAITATSASSGGATIVDGGSLVTAKGVVWDIATAPTVSLSTKTNEGDNTTANFTSALAPLSPETLYYARAYATNNSSTAYANEITFRTLSATVATQSPSASATVIGSGSVSLSWGAATFPASGAAQGGYAIVYSTNGTQSLTSANGSAPAGTNLLVVTPTTLSSASPATSTTISGLVGGSYSFTVIPFTYDGINATTYNYLTTSAPTASVTVITNPSITTTAVTSISDVAATSGGTTINVSGGTVLAKGIVYSSTNATPTLSDTVITDVGTSTASFTSNLTGLTSQTLYYVRAYVTNEVDTAYGSAVSFYTYAPPVTAQATAMTATTTSAANIDLAWSVATFPSATTTGYVLIRASGANTPSLSNGNGVAPAAGANTTIISSSIPGATATFSNASLTAATTYNYRLVPFTWNGTNAATYNYLTSGTIASATATTLATAPTAQPTIIAFSAVTASTITTSWTAATGSPAGYIVVRGTAVIPNTDPVAGTTYSAGNALGNGTVVYVGSAVTTAAQTGLVDGITYNYKIYSYTGSGASINYLLTSPLGGSQATSAIGAPTATAATSVTSSGFTANWSAVSGAANYQLDMGTNPCFATFGTPTATTEGFAGGTATPPSGWTITAGATYTSAGNFGAASPSLNLNATGQLVRTNLLSGSVATQLSFWIKGQGTDASSALLVEGTTDGTNWTTIENITNSIPTSGTTKSYNSSSTPALPCGMIQFRFTYTKSNGNLAFDDVAITSASSASSFISGYNNLSVSGTSQAISGLSGGTTYYYRVRTVSTNSTSINSNVITAITLNDISTADFRYKASTTGNWSTIANWEYNLTGVTWAAAGQLPGTTNNVSIPSTSNVTLDQGYTINSGKTLTVSGILDTSTNIIQGTGNFSLASSSTLKIGSADGINSTGSTGNIQTTTRVFGATANYQYNGAGNQMTGTGLPFTITTGSLGINSGTNTVTLTTTGTTTPTLSLISGTFATGSGSTINITSGGTVSSTTGTVASGADGGTINFNGTGTISGTLDFNNLTLNGATTLPATITVNGNLTFNATTASVTNAPTYGASSNLIYAANVSRGGEWSATSPGTGYPANVIVQNGATLTASQSFDVGCSGNLQLGNTGSAGSINMVGAGKIIVAGNVTIGSNNGTSTLTLSSTIGGDIKVGGNWTRTSNGAFTPNGRAVFFTGSGTNVINSTGGAAFDYLVSDKTAGVLQLGSNLTVNAPSGGNALSLKSAASYALNGNTLNLTNAASSNVLADGGTVNFTGTGTINFANSTKTCSQINSGSFAFGSNVALTTSTGVNFGAGLSTINGTFQINGGGFVQINAPIYGSTSTLIYNSNYGRNLEWSATSGAGYPNNVAVIGGSTLDLSANGFADRALAGDLTLGVVGGTAGSLSMGATTNKLTVGGNIIVGGNTSGTSTLTLSSAVGGDIYINGNWTRNTGGSFVTNSRAVFFQGTGTSMITTISTASFDYLFINKTSTGKVVLANDMSVNNNLTFSSDNTGVIQTDGFKVIVPTTATITRTGSGHINGNLRRFVPTGTVTGFNLPIGDATNYSPAAINFTGTVSGSGYLDASVSIPGAAPSVASGLSQTKYVDRKWTIINTGVGGFTSFAPTFTFVAGDVQGSASTSLFGIRNLNGSTWSNTTLGAALSTSTSASEVTVFGDYYIGEGEGIAVTTQPVDATTCAGSNASFTAASTSTPTPAIQWQEKVGAGSFTNITNGGVYDGANTGTLIITGATVEMSSNQYQAVFSNINGSTTSSAKTLTVNSNLPASVSIAITSGAQTICAGTSVTFTATPTNGGATPAYQWKVNGVDAASTTDTFTTAALANSDQVTVEMTSTACATGSPATSNSISMTVNSINTITLSSAAGTNAQTLCNTADFASITYATTEATGATFSGLPAGVTGNWASDVVTISGTPTVSGSFNYTVTLTGGCGNVTATGNITANFTVWNGSGWSNAAPTASVGAIIAGNYSVAADLAACSLIVNNNAIVTVPSGFDFTIVGKVDVQAGSSLTFDNNANLLQSGTTNANTGEITSKRTNTTMRRLDYTYWSSPTAKADYALKTFSPMTLSLIPSEPGGVTGTSRFYYLDEVANAFVNVEPTTTYFDDANIARGWSIRAPNTFPANGTTATFLAEFIGKPNNGDYSRTVTTSNRGYNLIGNPYPSPISASDFLAANPGALYFWTHKVQNGAPGTNYATLTTLGFAQPAPTDNLVFEGIIQTGQGFLYKPTTAGTAVFNNSMRRSDNRGQFFRDGNEGIERHRIWLNLSDSNNAGLNQILVGYMTGATQDVDSSIDGVLNYTGTGIATTINDQNFAIQGRSLPFEATDEVPMNFKAETDGSYTIAIDHVDGLFSGDQNIYLKDNLTGITHNIKESAYTFASVAGTFASRFAVVYQSAPLGIETPSLDANSVIVYKKDTSLHINSGSAVMASVKIYDIRGRLIIEQNNINASTTVFNNLNAEQQVLLVQITSDDNKVVTKKVVY